MKLYATITSERASKGQGGNNHATVELIAENQENGARNKIGWLNMYYCTDGQLRISYNFYDDDSGIVELPACYSIKVKK